jgi:hypothetical protein
MNRHRTISFLTALLVLVVAGADAQQNVPVKIVGIGAANCARFTADAAQSIEVEKHYIAWMQGYMSGIMVGRPTGVDEGIDLEPTKFPLRAQIQFVHDFCLKDPKSDFADAVEQLYVRLKRLNAT